MRQIEGHQSPDDTGYPKVERLIGKTKLRKGEKEKDEVKTESTKTPLEKGKKNSLQGLLLRFTSNRSKGETTGQVPVP